MATDREGVERVDSIDEAGEGADHPVGSEADFRRVRLDIAYAALQRIRRLWRVLFGGKWFPARHEGDEHVYQWSRALVLKALDGPPVFDGARWVALDALPETLGPSGGLVCVDEEITDFYDSGFQDLEAELVRLALSEGAVLGDPDVSAVFAAADDFLDRIEAHEQGARRLGLLPPAMPPPSGETGKAPRRAGPNKAQVRAAQRRQDARRLRDERFTIQEIAMKLKCSERTIQKDLANLQ